MTSRGCPEEPNIDITPLPSYPYAPVPPHPHTNKLELTVGIFSVCVCDEG